MEWIDYKDPHSIARKRLFPLPRSLANFKRDFSEKKWTEARDWGSSPRPATAGARENGDRAERPVLGCRYPQCSHDRCALCVVRLLAPTHVGFVALPGDRVSRGTVLQAGAVREHG